MVVGTTLLTVTGGPPHTLEGRYKDLYLNDPVTYTQVLKLSIEVRWKRANGVAATDFLSP